MIVNILILLGFPAVFAGIGFLFGYNPLEWFAVSAVAQFIFIYTFTLTLRTIATLKLNRMEIDRLNAMDANKVSMKCSVCNEPHIAVVKWGENNEFRCERCKSLNQIDVNITNHQRTEIVEGLITEDIVQNLNKE